MRIAGHDYLIDQNDRLRTELQQNINVPKVSNDVSTVPSKDNEDGNKVTLDFSSSARIKGSESMTAKSFPTTDFSTSEDSQNNSSTSSNAGNAVLNQYRFFVQSNQYQDNDGIVKRIFR